MKCRICENTIPPERLDRWSWAVTCSTDCSMANEGRVVEASPARVQAATAKEG